MTEPRITLHGIVHCNTVKRARDWLDQRGVPYTFHDFKKAGVPDDALARWTAALGWETLLNRRGTTWRKFDEATQQGVVDAASAQALMRENSSVIKRPVVDWPDGQTTVGFSDDVFEAQRTRLTKPAV